MIDTEILEDIIQAFSDRNCHQPKWLLRLFLRNFLLGSLLAILLMNDLFFMLLTHIVDLHACKGTILQTFLKRKSRMIRMHMYLHDLIIRYNNERITD